MEAIALSVLNNPTSLLLGETVYRLLPVASCKTLSFHNKNSSIRAYDTTNWGGNLSSRKSFSGRAFEEDEFSTHITSDSKSSRREKLIALFKRIQIEISEGESGSGNYSKSTQSIDDDSSVETSVLEFLQQSSRETKVESSKLKHSEEPNRKKQTSGEKSISVPEPPPTKFTRPPSNFVKKSPIPLTTALQSNEIELNNKESSSESDRESLKVEGMKLSELKGLAKERGIRGYSKLKKSELVELLNS
ncbi:SAP-like protein BP-73 [Chenopodium quinoa]|uniref:Rho termination factor-like N-terminal domain-containing protein n=1 Tax=Chenopodium quinoa TaxID=63459 RepID=A0A803N2Q3_CHEQI|nr:SAP-like protein BP-73 [Chenopodium quinoa]